MNRVMLQAKLHRATVTEADLHYEDSGGINEDLLDTAYMREFERIQLDNVNNRDQFATYIIRAKRGSGSMSLNGAATRKAQVGDLLIICTYAPLCASEVAQWKSRVVLLGEGNRVTQLKEL